MNLLITGAWNEAKKHIKTLESMGHSVVFMQQEREELPCAPDMVEGIICNGLFLYHPIEQFTSLKYIQLTSAGFDRVPMDYVRNHDIKIYNAKGVYSIPMAEFAVSGVLQLYKQSHFFYENQKKHIWNKHRGLLELYGKKVCIVGCGSVGTECAKRFKAFGCCVTGINLHPRLDENYEEMMDLNCLNKVLPKSDIVILTLPLTDETNHLMNESRLGLLNKDAILVNIARGAIIDISALIKILPKIGGAVLDVFEEEPLEKNSRLWDMENVVVTPHNSFIGSGNQVRLNKVILENIQGIRGK